MLIIATPPKFMLRLPEGMRERIAAAAHINDHSVNVEIVDRVQNSFAPALSALPWQDTITMLQKEATECGTTITFTMASNAPATECSVNIQWI